MQKTHKPQTVNNTPIVFTGQDIEELVTRLMGDKCSTIDYFSITEGDKEYRSNKEYTIDMTFLLKAF
jgi:hypothetical protein